MYRSIANKKSRPSKIIVALSGGVDSAVAAALLKKQGYDVVGVFFRLGEFAWKSEVQVKKIAKKIGIPLRIVDARKEFRKKIVDYFISSYEKGITPNPCVKCNEEIKFKFLFDILKKEKADFVATGHYARNLETRFPSRLGNRVSKWRLMQAKDKNKDQSYFLYRLTQKELAKIIFPLGKYEKTEVRKIAKKLKLPISKSEESQDVCFVAGNETAEFLRQNIRAKKGNVVDSSGNILGTHVGLPFYTLGQRKGIRIGGTGPYFAIKKNKRKNELIVSNNPKDVHLWSDRFYAANASWISKNLKFPLDAKVKIRYHAPSFSVIINKEKNGKREVRSRKKIRAVASGQSAVFYKNNEILGGGIII